MHRRRIMLVLAAALTALLALPATSLAATPGQIYRDAEDGVLNGNYSLQELRAADAQISAEQREYYLWDEMYAAALARIRNPSSPKPPKLTIVKPVDSNGNGRIDDAEVKAAAAKTKQINKQALDKLDDIASEPAASDDDPTAVDEDTTAEEASNSDADEGGISWALVVFVVLLVAIAAIGAWRVLANRKRTPKRK